MSDHTAAVERARQAWNAGDLAGYLALYHDGIRLHGYLPEPMTKTKVTHFYQGIWAALPRADLASPGLEFHEILNDGAMYCCRFTMSGSQSAEFMGVPASGRPEAMAGITIMRFEGDQVIERWSTSDFLGMLVQIGALPPRGA